MKKAIVKLVLCFAGFAAGIANAQGCYSDLDCDFPQKCENGVCAGECFTDLDCNFPEKCENTVCTGGCFSDLDCDWPDRCIDNTCKRTRR